MAVGPLNQRDALSENVIVESKFEHGLAVIEPVEIEVVNRQAPVFVLVHQDEGRAGDFRVASQTGHETLHELRFSGSEVSPQRKHVARTRAAGVAAPYRPGFLRVI